MSVARVYFSNESRTATQPHLSVRRLERSEYPKVQNILERWIECSKALRSQNEFLSEMDIWDNLAGVGAVSRTICEKLASKKGVEQLYGCFDDAKRLQGIAEISSEEDALTIEELATHPENIYGRIEPKVPCVKGVGTMLVRAIEAEGITQKKRSIVIIPTKSSEGFYRHLGYDKDAQSCMHKVLPI